MTKTEAVWLAQRLELLGGWDQVGIVPDGDGWCVRLYDGVRWQLIYSEAAAATWLLPQERVKQREEEHNS